MKKLTPIQQITPIFPAMFYGSRKEGEEIIEWVVNFGGKAGIMRSVAGDILTIVSQNGRSIEVPPCDWVFHDPRTQIFSRIPQKSFNAKYRIVEDTING